MIFLGQLEVGLSLNGSLASVAKKQKSGVALQVVDVYHGVLHRDRLPHERSGLLSALGGNVQTDALLLSVLSFRGGCRVVRDWPRARKFDCVV